MLPDYFSVGADVRPSIANNKQKEFQYHKMQQEDAGDRAFLVKLYQERVLAGRDIWTGDFIPELKDTFK